MREQGKARPLSILLKLAGLTILFLLSVSFLGSEETERKDSGMTKFSSAYETASASPAGAIIWQLGSRDESAGEFAPSDSSSARSTVSINSSKPDASVLKQMPSGLDGRSAPELHLSYRLNKIPVNGVLLQVSILDAYKSVPQMAVFSNSELSGIIQIAGVAGTGSEYKFRKTYELYIPKEQLQVGDNELKLKAVHSLYASSAEEQYLWWTWDDLKLLSLDSPITEPIHGSYVLTGTMVANKQFYFDTGATTHLPYIMKWLGVAYSGNIMRTGGASDVSFSRSDLENYYKVLKDYNMQAVALYLYTGDIKLNADGSLPESAKKKLTEYFQKYGSYIQYYEVDNEPGLFNRSKAVNLAIAEWLNKEGKKIAPHLQTVAPGWTYWPTYKEDSCEKSQRGGVRQCGDPDGWERDPAQRMELEKVTDLTNGHSYGDSYIAKNGGSFTENLKTFKGSNDGLPKKMLVTEFGTSDTHVDDYHYGAKERTSAAFDRIMRAHIGYADMFVQHAAFFYNYSLFQFKNVSLKNHDPAKTEVYYTKENEDSRVSIMRRMSLAYATHGAPLTYRLLNKSALADKLVYVRAVDTSKLAPLPGTNATSNKVLVNLVNFEDTQQTVSVKVTLPKKAAYEGERFGNGDTYEEARRYVSGLNAGPDLTFTETLAPGEAVQYILQPSSAVLDEAPRDLTATAARGTSVQLNWLEAPGTGYDVLRSEGTGGELKTIAKGVGSTSYIDRALREGELYTYAVRVTGTALLSDKAQITATGLVPLDRTGWKASDNINQSQKKLSYMIDGDPSTRWDTGVNMTSGEAIQIDMGTSHMIEAVQMDTSRSSYDFPRGYAIYVSEDAVNWELAAAGRGKKDVDMYPFPQRKARYVRIVQTGAGGNFWSIHELQIYSRE
ncbi:Fibronectin type III domain-containing protein [Paenibacillus sophorae]|uniref:Fibronectin type III domain-containing protein n=2 Tax=Paenibacillus sophorae TaxID=1333845 RepID=A0A1H8T9Q7_9BACL|nr:discoidin domain-containing protein [Paenibacillus sophorae]SEO87611.1 Fibronectin type III domain-containing protein [Paenibacillus sophorae]